MKNEARGWDDAPMTCYKRDNDNDFSEEDGEDFNGGDEEDDSVKGEYFLITYMHNDKLFLFFPTTTTAKTCHPFKSVPEKWAKTTIMMMMMLVVAITMMVLLLMTTMVWWL